MVFKLTSIQCILENYHMLKKQTTKLQQGLERWLKRIKHLLLILMAQVQSLGSHVVGGQNQFLSSTMSSYQYHPRCEECPGSL